MAKRGRRLSASTGRALAQGGRLWLKAAQLLLRQAGQAGQTATRAAAKKTARTLSTAAARRRPPAASGDWLPGLAVAAGGARRFRLYRPAGVQAGERLPLVVMLHGCGQDAAGFAASTGLHKLADHARFCVLYPDQDRLANAQGCWNWYDTRNGRAQAEVGLLLAAIDQVARLYPVDAARTAVVGLSAGASMAALLARSAPQRFAAVVMHSGVPPGAAHSTLTALGAMQGRRVGAAGASAVAAAGLGGAPPPLLVIHGDADPVVSVRNAHAAVLAQAAATGATAAAPRVVQRGQRRPMTVTDYLVGRRVVATLAEVGGLGHAWSGGSGRLPYGDPRGPDASRLAWSFIARQFRR